jgi:hypothetical protein
MHGAGSRFLLDDVNEPWRERGWGRSGFTYWVKDETAFCVESDLVFVGVGWFNVIITWRSGWVDVQQARPVDRL